MILVKWKNKISEGLSKKERIILWVACTLALLAIVFGCIMYAHSRMPVYIVNIDGLDVKTPSEAQYLARSQSDYFRSLQHKHPNCIYVWCGSRKLYLVAQKSVTHIGSDENQGFEKVKFYNTNGLKVTGYVIDPAGESTELGRLSLVGETDADFESVSMSVRVGLRSGEISYKDAAFLWESGSREVIVVKKNAVTVKAGKKMTYVDDGDVEHVCYVLDTKL